MEIEDIQQYKIFECIAGSQAYGTNHAESDIDIRGIYVLPSDHHLSLSYKKDDDFASDEKNDIMYYELKKYIKLATECNPNIIEFLYTPNDCIRVKTELMDRIIENSDMFISKMAYESFSNYAMDQIKRAKGQNKWINNKKSESPPSKLDFCWIIPLFSEAMSLAGNRKYESSYQQKVGFPARPVPLKDSGYNLSNHVVAKLEHCENTYRLYSIDNAKGVFRGKSEQLVVESISKEDEFLGLTGFLIYNEGAYKKEKKDWKNYWDWKKNRNEARYRTQENGEVDYDCKNMLHCFRLLWSGENILKHGEPIVRFEGEKLEYLMKIRAGEFKYDDLIKEVDDFMENLKEVKKNSTIPDEPDKEAIDRFYLDLIK